MPTAIHTIDVNYLNTPGAIASYIVIGPGGDPVMVETGPGCAVEGLVAGLKELGFRPRDVRDVLVTHIHFDHAGAAGWMAREGARIHVHEFGAAHLVDPTRLVRSAERIYGDRMGVLWGELIPVPEKQVRPVYDGDAIDAGGLRFRAIETPGHARHHHAYGLETEDLGRVAFTGDAAATFVEEAPGFISLPTPPPEFELAAWISSLDRLGEEGLDRIYPTHFGVVED
ncbi:MAG: MBL fold metallo-hydrolase, partial [Phycisphaerae bacterium]|nr:MBL fold metallo-hydrolase [Phycisphaerae bacterium]